MQQVLNVFQIVISLGLITAILLQSQGGGLGQSFGGGGSSYRTRRGAEKIIYYATIVLAVLFILSSLFRLLI